MLEGNRKQILKLKKELRKRLNNDGIVTKEIVPEVVKPNKKAVKAKEVVKKEVKRKTNKK
jgi:hypothetical protein